MRYPEREAIVERLPYEYRLGFVAFCVERCLNEARRHALAREQLTQRPLLGEGLAMLWTRAESGVAPDAARVKAVRDHVASFERPADDENVEYTADVILVQAAHTLNRGMRLLQDPKLRVGAIARAIEGPLQAVSAVYKNWEVAQDAEAALLDAVLVRLGERSSGAFSREVFAGLPDWARGEVSPKYAQGLVTGTDVNKDD
jgi:hypothetical protein